MAGAAIREWLHQIEVIAADGSRVPSDVEAAMAEIVTLSRAIDRAEAAIAVRLAVADAGKGQQLFGRRSLGAWLAAATGSRAARAGERVTLAQQLSRLPDLAAQLAEGSLPFGAAAAVASAVRHLDDTDTRLAEPILLGLAGDPAATVEDVAHAGRVILETVDPGGRLARAAALTERQHLSIAATLNGMGRVTGLLDPELTLQFQTWLEPLAVKNSADDARNHGKRMADALAVRLSQGGRRTVMHVAVTEQTLTGESQDPAHLQDGTVIPAADARRMAYTADLRRVLRDADGALLDLGRARRLASTDQREAILAQYATCCREGCDIPAYLAEIDHIQPWHPTGRTDLTNLAPLCAPDNKWKSRHPDKVDIIDHPNGTVTMRFHRHPKLHPRNHRQQSWQPRQPQQAGHPWQPGRQTPTNPTPTPTPTGASHPTPPWPPPPSHPTPAPPGVPHPTPAPPRGSHPTPAWPPPAPHPTPAPRGVPHPTAA
ncbi:HNH endonuclease signature motif containing protein [Acrocarpospora pleiomorpha]|uniref:HNH endonuclease signature motif containing protein n=1 Tax=Acrocarpospora pleiomorpha TaxID=90975 RepID=UPI0031DDE893